MTTRNPETCKCTDHNECIKCVHYDDCSPSGGSIVSAAIIGLVLTVCIGLLLATCIR